MKILFRGGIHEKLFYKIIDNVTGFMYSTENLSSVNALERTPFPEENNSSTVIDGDYKVTSIFNKSSNTITIMTYENGILIEDLSINISKTLQDYFLEQQVSPYTIQNIDTNRVLERRVKTVLNYEYERWYYPNYAGKFYNCRTFANAYRMMYLAPNSRYNASISDFTSGVDTIKEKELTVGIAAMLTIGAAILTGGISVVLESKIISVLAALGIYGAASEGAELYQAIRKCQQSWTAIYG